MKALESLHKVAPTRRLTIARELTKMYEETIRGTLSELINHFKERNIKGEIVIILEGRN